MEGGKKEGWVGGWLDGQLCQDIKLMTKKM